MPEGYDSVAGYVRVSTDDQDESRQRDAVKDAYPDADITWYVDIAESGGETQRQQYQRLRDEYDQHDIVAAAELDRLGRSFSELAAFVEELREEEVGLDCVNQPISTVKADDWMQEMMLNLMIVFADAERRMIQDRVQEGIDKAIAEGKHVGRPPFGYTVEDGILVQKPTEYARAQQFIREVARGRAKRPTADFFDVPRSAIDSILKRSEENYDIEFDNDQWRIERAKVQSGDKEIDPLGDETTPSVSG